MDWILLLWTPTGDQSGIENFGPLFDTCGVPQGWILSPLLFASYMNDLPTALPDFVKSNLCADDTAFTLLSANKLAIGSIKKVYHQRKSSIAFFSSQAKTESFIDIPVNNGD